MYHEEVVFSSSTTSVPFLYFPMILCRVPVPERSIRREPFVLTFQTSRLTAGVACVIMVMPGVMEAGTGARRMQPSTRRRHLPASSNGCSRVNSHSPFNVSVTVQDKGDTGPRPLLEKSVLSGV